MTVCGVSLILLPFYTALLPPSAMGTAEIFITTAVLLMPLFSFYAPQATFRFLAQGAQNAVRTGGALLGVGLLLLLCLIPLLERFPTLYPYRYLLYFYVCASLLRSFSAHILRARGQFGIFALQQSFCSLLTALFQLLFLRATRLGVVGYLLGILLGDSVTFVILAACFFPFSRWEKHFDPVLCGKMLRYALPLMPAALLWWAMGAVEKYFLLYYHGTASMGVYAVAGRFPSLIGFATGVFLEVWHYAALQAQKGSEGELYGHVYALMLPFAIGAGVAVSVVAPFLILRVLASAYGEATRALGLLSVGAVCAGLSSFLDSVYTLRLRSVYSLISASGAATLHVLLSYFLVPRWGIVGAAASGAIAYAGLFFLRLWHTSRMLSFPRYTRKSALSLTFLLIGGIWMAKGYVLLSVATALGALLPMAGLLWQSTCFLYRRTRVILHNILKRKEYTAQ